MKKGRWVRFAIRKGTWKRGRLGAVCRVLVLVGIAVGVVCGVSQIGGMDGQKVFAVPANEIGRSVLDKTSLDEFAQNQVLFYYPCDGIGGGSETAGSCAKLAELRQAMWNKASEEDKNRFVNVVANEDAGLAATEAFMNQIVSQVNSDGSLSSWLDDSSKGCHKFMQHGSICDGSKNPSQKEKGWIEKALGGSNITNGATGNAYGHSDSKVVGAVTCIWVQDTSLEDNGKCADVDYSKSTFVKASETGCSTLVEEARKEDSSIPTDPNHEIECWGWDNTTKWSKSMASQCGGNNSLGSTPSTSTNTSSSISWDEEGWITGGMDGYTKEPSGGDGNDEYEHGKPNKIVLHYTQGKESGLGAYGESPNHAAHFTIDLLNKKVAQHVPLSKPSGALAGVYGGPSDTYDNVQIEIVGYGFQKNNPDSPSSDSKCIIDGKDETSSEYCFAKFGDEEWGYLAKLLKGISKWGKSNGTNIPLTTSVKWTGDVQTVRLSKADYDKTVGIVAHMHVPYNTHDDTGNIWPMVQAALGEVQCDLNGDENSISGAKNAEKQASEVGEMSALDVKAVISNYGDLAYRTGQAYGLPWIGILAQAMNESPTGPKNNFWGIKGGKEWAELSNLGEGFKLYGKTTQQDRYKEALEEKDPYEYIKKLGEGGWCEGGYSKEWLKGTKSIVKSLTEYIESDEGKQAIAEFGATSCDTGGKCSITDGTSVDNGTGSSAILAAVEKIMDLAAKNGSHYVYGGGRSIKHFKDVVNNGAENNIDCTGFASMVYWMVYEDEFEESDIFSSSSIVEGMSSYKEVDRSDVRPGDIFAYTSPRGHGGIVVEVENGKVTKIAEVKAQEGKTGKNKNIGYSGKSDFSVKNANSSNGHFYRWKGDNS